MLSFSFQLYVQHINDFVLADLPAYKWLTLTIYLTPLFKFQLNKINAKMAHEEFGILVDFNLF